MDEAKRHHYLPRFLLKGFAGRTAGPSPPEYFAYLAWRGAGLREVNITNVAVERFFHGHPGKDSVEGAVTKAEGRYAPILDELRNGAALDDRRAEIMVEFVAHLIVRTRHLRLTLAEAMRDVFALFQGELASPRSQLRRRIRRGVLKSPKVRAPLGFLPRAQRAPLIRLLRGHLRELEAQISPLYQAAFSRFDIEGRIREHHIRTLGAGDPPSTRVDILAQLPWSMAKFAAHTLVLGDCGPVGYFEGQRVLDLPLKNLRPDAIVLPIADGVLLVGGTLPPGVDGDALNLGTAELSRDFFVSSACSDREQGYAQRIGARAMLATPDEMREWLGGSGV